MRRLFQLSSSAAHADAVVAQGRLLVRLSTVSITLVAMIFMGLMVYQRCAAQASEARTGEMLLVKKFEGLLPYLNEVLDTSARMAAFTGDPAWETRYGTLEPELDRAIKAMQRITPESQGLNAVSEIDQAHIALEEMQRHAFDLVRAGNLADAQALLLGTEYQVQEDIYANGLKQFGSLLDRHTHALVRRQQRADAIAAIITALLCAFVLTMWIATILVIRRWSRLLLDNHRRLVQQTDELEALTGTLEDRVTQRTGELTQRNQELDRQQRAMRSLLEDLGNAKAQVEQQAADLEASNTKLKELAGLKDEFVAKVSHELRTPLTSIKEGLSLLLDGALGPTTADQQDFLKTMDGDVDRLTELINNMLDISKIEAGRLRLLRVRLDVPKLIQSLLHSYQAILGRRRVGMTLAGETPPVFGDANRLLQVLINLLSNALKYTPQDGSITFRVAPHDGMVAIAVTDSGPGITPEDVPKLFQKFSQVGTRTDAPKGTGLGLVVCKELTELHGGRIEVSSEVGRGTTFTVYLPVYKEAFVLEESFQELVRAGEGGPVGMVVLQAQRYLAAYGQPEARAETLERLAAEVRQHLHRGDIVVTLEPSQIVVLASADAGGTEAIVNRLQKALPSMLSFGTALSSVDGEDAHALLECASSRVQAPDGATAPKAEG